MAKLTATQRDVLYQMTQGWTLTISGRWQLRQDAAKEAVAKGTGNALLEGGYIVANGLHPRYGMTYKLTSRGEQAASEWTFETSGYQQREAKRRGL